MRWGEMLEGRERGAREGRACRTRRGCREACPRRKDVCCLTCHLKAAVCPQRRFTGAGVLHCHGARSSTAGSEPSSAAAHACAHVMLAIATCNAPLLRAACTRQDRLSKQMRAWLRAERHMHAELLCYTEKLLRTCCLREGRVRVFVTTVTTAGRTRPARVAGGDARTACVNACM